MRFLLTPNGTFGDVQPYLGIAEALRARGQQVTFICNPYFREIIEGLGHELIPLRTAAELEEFWHHADMWHGHRYWQLGLEYSGLRPMRDMYSIIASQYKRGETVLVGPAWSFGARIAQEHLGIPLATVHLEPFWLRSLYRSALMPPPMLIRDWAPRFSKRFQFWLADEFFTDRYLAKPINSFRSELGLPPARRFLKTWWHSPQRVIGLFPPWFFAPQPDWPPQTRLTQFPLWDRSEVSDLSPEVDAFLCDGSPPVAFTPGTENRQAEAFFAAAVEACRYLGMRAILLTNYPQQLPKNLPQEIRHFEYVPLRHMKGRLAAVVHHAGTGTAAQCMRAGIPQVVMPMAYDQPDFAACLERLGVAKILRPREFRAKALIKSLEYILHTPRVAMTCQVVAEKFEGVAPFEQVCDLLEELGDRIGIAT
jgi:UDP:flavonoid glycosyltransferase YjiC (YdhE family)